MHWCILIIPGGHIDGKTTDMIQVTCAANTSLLSGSLVASAKNDTVVWLNWQLCDMQVISQALGGARMHRREFGGWVEGRGGGGTKEAVLAMADEGMVHEAGPVCAAAQIQHHLPA